MSNPFLALFESDPDDPVSPPPKKVELIEDPNLLQRTHDLIESVFGLTLNKFRVLGRGQGQGGLRDGGLIWLKDMAEEIGPHKTGLDDPELLQTAVFERLLMEKPEQFVITEGNNKVR